MIKYVLIFILLINSYSGAQLCRDFQIWDGSEPIHNYGIDSTGNWWIITRPFADYKRLIVNHDTTEEYNQIFAPIFSLDGRRWASFAEYQGTWYIITQNDLIELKATRPGDLLYTPNSKFLIYSYFSSDLEYIVLPEKTIQVYGKIGSIFVSQDATNFAFKGMRGNKFVLNINGNETTTFDDIIPIGFWHDNSFIYAAKNGLNWQIFKNNKAITRNFALIKNPLINPRGTVLAFIAETFSNNQIVVTISDEYNEPLESRPYDMVSYLSLHPEYPLVTFFAKIQNNSIICVNTAEYSTSSDTSPPYFTSDGEDVYFLACDFGCYVSVNGRRYPIKYTLHPRTSLAKKSSSNTIAYTNNTSLNLLFLETDKLHSGMMVDRTTPPIYNSRSKRYEALGQIGNRLYLLTCRPQ